MRILIVEDDAIAAYLTQNLLDGFGYEVVGTVTTGEEAILQSKRLQPDLILMDIKLEGVYNGVEAAQIIQDEQNIPIIYLTAGDTGFFENVVKTTSYGYLSKPVDKTNLKLTIEIARHKFQYEKRLRESEELYRLLSENSKDLICLHEVDGTFLYVSNSVKDVLGYEPEELIGRNASEFLFHVGIDLKISQFDSQEEGLNNEKKLLQQCVQRKDGRSIWIETLAKTIFDKHGKAIKLQTSSRDITDRKLAEEKLKKISLENSKLAIVTSNTNNAVIITDPEGYIEWTNVGFSLFSEYTLEEVKGKKPGSFLQGAETDPGVIAFMREELKMQRGFKAEVLNYSRSGRKYWVDMEIQPLFDEGKLINFLALQLNITERKANEAALKKSKEEAEIANQAKSEFLSNMSHEIRTPLNAIIGLTEILLDEKVEPHILDNIRTAKYSADSLLQIVNNILDFSKIESGKFTFEALEFVLGDVINNLHRLVQTRVADKNISIHFNVSPDIPDVLIGDSFRLNQILLNLLSNAMKFTHEGLIELIVYPILHRRDQITLLFEIRDTGIGIDNDKLSRIFESFSQANTSTTRRFGGTGLGLSITKNMVDLQGGSIWVESKSGEGSIFYFELPFLVSDKKVLMPDIAPLNQRNNLEGVSILLVEDNVINRTLNEQLFKKWKVSYECAEDGLQAIEILKKRSFDVILMDVQMPHMDGYETARFIRNPESAVLHHDVPIIALTANAFAHSRQLALESGMNEFISKPFKQEQLLQAILQFIGPKEEAFKPAEAPLPPKQNREEYQWIDLSIIKDIVENDEEALILVLNEFVDSAHLEVSRLRQAYAQKEMQRLADVAHKLRSAFRYLGKNQVEKQIHELEMLARQEKEIALIGTLVDEVVFCYNATLEEVKEVLDDLKGKA